MVKSDDRAAEIFIQLFGVFADGVVDVKIENDKIKVLMAGPPGEHDEFPLDSSIESIVKSLRN